MEEEDLFGKRLLCSVFYLPSGGARVYPQYVIEEDGRFTEIKEEDCRNIFAPEGSVFFPERDLGKWTLDRSVLEMRIKSCGLAENFSPGFRRDDRVAYVTSDSHHTANASLSPFKFESSFLCVPVPEESARLKEKHTIPFYDQCEILKGLSHSIFLECVDGMVVGPFNFELDGKAGRILLRGTVQEDYNVRCYPSYVLRRLPFRSNEKTILRILPLAELNKVKSVWQSECIPDEVLHEILLSCLKTKSSDIANVKALRNSLNSVLRDASIIKTNPSRMRKFEAYLGKIDDYENFINALSSYVSSNFDAVVMPIISSRGDIRRKITEKDDSYQSLKQRCDRAEKAQSELQKKLEEQKKKGQSLRRPQETGGSYESPASAGVSAQIENLRHEEAELRNRISDQKQQLSKLEVTIGEKQTEVEQAQRELAEKQREVEECRKELEEKKIKLDKKKKETKDMLNGLCADIKEQTKKLNEAAHEYRDSSTSFVKSMDRQLAKQVMSIMSEAWKREEGLFADMNSDELVSHANTKLDSVSGSVEGGKGAKLSLDDSLSPEMEPSELASVIVDRVSEYLQQAGRHVSRDEVINYLTCISQGFITTFAGNPGSGKTSLCNLLARSLGLVSKGPESHFVEVSVSRGWTSSKDFIGYYNPLSEKMVKSDAAVYDALDLTQVEDSQEVPPMVILLDEANLSPVEHYWSDFLRNSDINSSANRTFSLGGNKVWKIKDHLRFLATVNYDHTTEELSPRFLSRSWVVMLDEELGSDESLSGEWVLPERPAVPYWALQKAFGATQGKNMDDSLSDQWESIKDILRQYGRPIMPRSERMVTDYIRVAAPYMSDAGKSLDYALAQKILPSMNGTGENIRKCLQELSEWCGKTMNTMPETLKQLRIMLDRGSENMNIYQFFAR